MATASIKELPVTDPTAILTQLMQVMQAYDPEKKTTTSGTPGSQASVDALLANLLGQTTSGAYSKDAAFKDSDAIVQQIFNEFQNTALPQIYNAQANSGGYNSTTGQLLANDAFSRTVAQAQAAKLKAASDYGAVANATAANAVNAGKVAQENTKTSTATKEAGLMTKLLGGASLAAKAAPFLLGKDSAVAKGAAALKAGKRQDQMNSDDISNAYEGGSASSSGGATGGGGGTPSFSDLTSASDTSSSEVNQLFSSLGFNSDTSAFNASAAKVGSDAGNPEAVDEGTGALKNILGKKGLDDELLSGAGSGEITETGASSFAGDAGVDFAGDFAADAALDVGFPYYTAFKAAGDLFGINEINDITGGVSQAFSDVTNTLGDAVSGVGDAVGSLFDTGYICTELARQQIISQQDRARVVIAFKKYLSPTTILGYKFWSHYFARLMKKSSLVTQIGKAIFFSWQEQIKGNNSALGLLMHYIVRPLTFCIGCIIELNFVDGTYSSRSN